MELFQKFIIDNFILICLSIVVLINGIQHRRQHPRISYYSCLIIICALLLAMFEILEVYGRSITDVFLVTIAAIFGYVLRPVCLYLFVLMSHGPVKNNLFFLTAIPILVVAIFHSLAFVPGAQEYTVYYTIGSDGQIHFGAGMFRYISHIVGVGYLIWLLYLSLYKLRAKHIYHGLAIMSCALFVVLSVVIETFFNANGDIYLLNATIGVSTITYFFYSYIEKTQIDTLTGLFNRETFYQDLPKFQKNINGVILFDLNGLKHINDTYGHHEGDKALATVSNTISKNLKKNMYAYRMGGDEFLVIATKCSELDLVDVVHNVKEALEKTPYHCSIGCTYRSSNKQSVTDAMKIAEEFMYKDKEEFYKNSPFERRKARA